jgi:hypothetical protein
MGIMSMMGGGGGGGGGYTGGGGGAKGPAKVPGSQNPGDEKPPTEIAQAILDMNLGFEPEELVDGRPHGSGRFSDADIRRGYKKV